MTNYTKSFHVKKESDFVDGSALRYCHASPVCDGTLRTAPQKMPLALPACFLSARFAVRLLTTAQRFGLPLNILYWQRIIIDIDTIYPAVLYMNDLVCHGSDGCVVSDNHHCHTLLTAGILKQLQD